MINKNFTLIDQNSSFTTRDIFKFLNSHSCVNQDQYVIIPFEKSLNYFLNMLLTWKANKCACLLPENYDIKNYDLEIFKKKKAESQFIQLEENNSPAIATLTSGSSGRPKWVVHSLESLSFSAKRTIKEFNYQTNDCFLMSLPPYYLAGFMIYFRAMLCGGKVISSSDIESALKDQSFDHLSFVPMQLEKYLNFNSLKKAKSILIGGSKPSTQQCHKFTSNLKSITFTYGMSETATHVATSTDGVHYNALSDVIIKTNNDKLCISTPSLFLGYFKNTNLDHFQEEYLETNDIVKIEDNSFSVVSRADRVFISGGINIDPSVIESKLFEENLVKNCALVPVKDTKFGEVGILVSDSKDIDKIKDCILSNFNKHSLPKAFLYKNEIDFFDKRNINRLKKDLNSFINTSHYTFNDNSKDQNIGFLHGFMGDKNSLRDFSTLFNNEYNTFLFDMPFHGKNNFKFDSFQQVTDIYTIVFQLLKINVLYGYSMGGRILLTIANHHAQLFDYLIAESAHPGLNKNELNQRRKFESTLFEDINNQSDFDSFIEKWYSQDIFKNLLPSEKMLKKDFNLISNFKKSLSITGTSKQPNLKEVLNDIHNLLYITGEFDEKYKKLTKIFSNKEIIKNASHNCHFMQPNETYLTAHNFIHNGQIMRHD